MIEFPPKTCYFCNSSFVKNTKSNLACYKHTKIVLNIYVNLNIIDVYFKKESMFLSWFSHDNFSTVEVARQGNVVIIPLNIEKFISSSFKDNLLKINTLLLFN